MNLDELKECAGLARQHSQTFAGAAAHEQDDEARTIINQISMQFVNLANRYDALAVATEALANVPPPPAADEVPYTPALGFGNNDGGAT